jgi:hypothetical protein
MAEPIVVVESAKRWHRVRPVVLHDVRAAFAQAAAEDGIVLESRSFDWLCEQGHIGLERVAKVRRDPALVGPVTAAVELLAAIYARLEGDLSVLYASRETCCSPSISCTSRLEP